MAKKTSRPQPDNSRAAKIQAAQKSTGSGANKIVVAAVVTVVAIVAVVGGVIWQQQSTKSKITQGGNAVPAGTSMGQGFPAFASVTPKDKAVTVDLFEDFQCPACQQLESILGPTIEDAAKAGTIKLRYHVKNFLDDKLGNDSSQRAGIAAFCAADGGKFQEYHDALYANQPTEGVGWTNAQLTDYAKKAGLNGEALTTWQSCFDAQKYGNYIIAVEEQSSKDGVNGTPTVWMNGKPVQLSEIASAELFTKKVQELSK